MQDTNETIDAHDIGDYVHYISHAPIHLYKKAFENIFISQGHEAHFNKMSGVQKI